ncbi:type II toxin-antitoxin system HicA family toxin [Candidatus Azambacteria bacterium]|nr:type II toxin-antitoxin system HicA family toxin [Candidatus Azambacteria bacterium]
MPKLKVLSGKEVVGIFEAFGFSVTGQKGSHIKLKRIHDNGTKQVLIIPDHQELDKGTLKAIYNQALKYISEQDLKTHFYA